MVGFISRILWIDVKYIWFVHYNLEKRMNHWITSIIQDIQDGDLKKHWLCDIFLTEYPANVRYLLIVEMPVICHTQWNPEVEYSSIFIFVSVTWGHTDTESTWCQSGIIEQFFYSLFKNYLSGHKTLHFWNLRKIMILTILPKYAPF